MRGSERAQTNSKSNDDVVEWANKIYVDTARLRVSILAKNCSITRRYVHRTCVKVNETHRVSWVVEHRPNSHPPIIIIINN